MDPHPVTRSLILRRADRFAYVGGRWDFEGSSIDNLTHWGFSGERTASVACRVIPDLIQINTPVRQ